MDQTTANVLIVDDTPKHLELMHDILKDNSRYRLFTAGSGPQALEVLENADIDIVLLDILMPDMDGYEVCKKIRKEYKRSPIQVVLISGIKSREDLDGLLELGADDFVRKPISPLELNARIQAAYIRWRHQRNLLEGNFNTEAFSRKETLTTLLAENRSLRKEFDQVRRLNKELEEENQELQKLASLDTLSGLLNRRTLFERIDIEIERSLRLGLPLTGIMIDIDHFKRINDNFGHPCGDVVIKGIGLKLMSSLRKYDFAGRYGGEEFFVLFPNATSETAAKISERFRSGIEESDFSCGEDRFQITVSIGIAQFRVGESQEKWISRADSAMYRAKQSGRNNVQVI